MIEINENIIGLWFASIEKGTGDLMAALSRRKDGALELNYRFRYYRDEKVWDSKDKKSWYHAVLKGEDVEHVLKTMRTMFAMSQMRNGANPLGYYELLRGTMTPKEFMEKLAKSHFAHVQRLSEKEAHEQGFI